MKKIISCILAFCLILPMSIMFSGCDKNDDKNLQLRVSENYIQWSRDGETWENLTSLDTIDGREIEFDKNSTHIIWRYKTADNSDLWKEVVAFEDLKEQEIVADNETIERGFLLFQSKLNDMNNYKVTYDYEDRYIVESFYTYGIYIPRLLGTSVGDERLWYTNILQMKVCMQYSYDAITSVPSQNIDDFHPYDLNIIGETAFGKAPKFTHVSSYKYNNDTDNYTYIIDGGDVNYANDSFVRGENFDYDFVAELRKFKKQDVRDCKFNENGDCIIEFNFTGLYSSKYPYLKSDYIYEFYVNKDGEILKCNIFEKDFFNPEVKGDLYCEVNYKKGESIIDSEFMNDIFNKIKEEDPDIIDWFDYFQYEPIE